MTRRDFVELFALAGGKARITLIDFRMVDCTRSIKASDFDANEIEYTLGENSVSWKYWEKEIDETKIRQRTYLVNLSQVQGITIFSDPEELT